MTIFEKNLLWQPGLPDTSWDGGDPYLSDTIDLTFITPDMVTRHFFPLIGVLFVVNDEIMIPGTKYTLNQIGFPLDDGPVNITYGDKNFYANGLKYNLILPSWMRFQAKNILRGR